MRLRALLIFYLICAAQCAAQNHTLEVSVTNESSRDRINEMIEIPVDSIGIDNNLSYIVIDQDGNEHPAQITHNGKLIFQATTGAGLKTTYTVMQRDPDPHASRIATGRIYPEHSREIAWENEYMGFRLYGPGNQAAGEKVYGYDIFFKHQSEEPILEKLYAQETSRSNWAKVDSLRAIDPRLADEFINSFSYHIDHGLGMDCYAVGPTLGAGTAAIILNDTIYYPWCYDKARVLDNGPLRFTVELDFAPVDIAGDRSVIEHRRISLDAGSRMNRCSVWYDGLNGERTIIAGFPRRDSSDPVMDTDNAIIAYADPTQRPDYGKALLGIIIPAGCNDTYGKLGHILIENTITPGQTFDYMWGFAWDKTDIRSLNQWYDILKNIKSELEIPLKVTYYRKS